MDTFITAMLIAVLVGAFMFFFPFVGEMLFEAIGLLIERIDYGKGPPLINKSK